MGVSGATFTEALSLGVLLAGGLASLLGPEELLVIALMARGLV